MLLLWWVVRWSLCFCIESEIVGRTTPVLRGMRQVGRTVTAILCNFHPPLVPVVEGRRDFFHHHGMSHVVVFFYLSPMYRVDRFTYAQCDEYLG